MRHASDQPTAYRVITDALPPVVASILTAPELETLRQRLSLLPEPPARPRLHRNDWLGALGVFLLVFLSTFPVVLPFLFMSDGARALRVSNAIAIALLFLTGYSLGRLAGDRPLRTGLWMVLLGTVLVAITVALGG